MNAQGNARRFDLDWLRVSAILMVFIFHTGRLFDTAGWHAKNPTTYMGVSIWTAFVASWLMPLIFVISGASLFYALGKGNAATFVKDKALRLLVPLVVGDCTHVALQVYVEQISRGRFQGSFFAFLPHYFDGFREAGGNFALLGLHLWYLPVLFVLSVAFLPLLRWLKAGSGRRVLSRLGDFLARPAAIYLLALPGMALIPWLNPTSQYVGGRDFGNWALPLYILYFLAGFVIIAHDGVQASIRRQRGFSLAGAAVAFLGLMVLYLPGGEPVFGTPRYAAVFCTYTALSWLSLFAILGFGLWALRADTPFLRYANQAVLPFYALHQSVIVGVGYLVVQQAIPDALKFLVVAVLSFAIIMGVYELLVRRITIMRFLFGMKPLARTQPAMAPETALAR